MATETITTFNAVTGQQVGNPATYEVPAEETNRRTLLQQAATALASNRTFLAINSPTNAQNAAQVKALTQQNQRLIRLAIGLLDGTD